MNKENIYIHKPVVNNYHPQPGADCEHPDQVGCKGCKYSYDPRLFDGGCKLIYEEGLLDKVREERRNK